MYVLGLGMLIEKLFRNIFFLIDEVIYNNIPRLYNLLITIARTSPLSQANIADMASRIYKLLAVFMVFKVTFSLIMYIVNPDDFSDKSKGVSKLITNIVISLAMLVLTPYIFNYAYQLQKIVLDSNAMATLVLGRDSANTSNAINTAGDQMAYLAISTFVVPNLNYFNCANMYNVDGNGNVILDERCFGFNDVNEYTKESFQCGSVKIDDNRADVTQLCMIPKDQANKDTIANYAAGIDQANKDTIANYAAGIQYGNYSLLFRKDIITAYADGSKEEFVIDYSFIMSTVVGILILLFLITTCMDIGLRSIKLAFLQLIAPIPILSYIDPKSGKDGMFKKWYQMALKTYLSLFIRLLAFYFAIYIISRIGRLVDITDGQYITNRWVQIFIIIGALMFAKNFIKILESLGIKFDGGFTLNPIKKINEQTLGGKKILGAAKGAVAGATIGAAGWATGAGFTRFPGALFGGIKSGIGGKKMGDIRKEQAQKNAIMRRAIAAGSTFPERMESRLSSFFGTPGRLGNIEGQRMQDQNKLESLKREKEANNNRIAKFKREQTALKGEQSAIDAMLNRAESKIEKGAGGQATRDYLDAKNEYELMKQNGVTKARAATNAEVTAARQKFETLVQKGILDKRAVTSEDIASKQAEINKLKAIKATRGPSRQGTINADIDRAERELEQMKTTGIVSYTRTASNEEVAAAKQEFEDLVQNGVVEHREATKEELTEAYSKIDGLKKAATFQYVTDKLADGSDAVMNDLNKTYLSTLSDPSQAITDGEELDKRKGNITSEINEIQRTQIEPVNRENQVLDDNMAALQSEIASLAAQKEDAKASQEAVGGIDGGPAHPSEIAANSPRERRYGYDYREGGLGSGVPDYESGEYTTDSIYQTGNRGGRGPMPGPGGHPPKR